MIDPGVRGGEGCLQQGFSSKAVAPLGEGFCALHNFLKVTEETKSLQMHVHYLAGIRNAIPLLVTGTRSSYSRRTHCNEKATNKILETQDKRFKTGSSKSQMTRVLVERNFCCFRVFHSAKGCGSIAYGIACGWAMRHGPRNADQLLIELS